MEEGLANTETRVRSDDTEASRIMSTYFRLRMTIPQPALGLERRKMLTKPGRYARSVEGICTPYGNELGAIAPGAEKVK